MGLLHHQEGDKEVPSGTRWDKEVRRIGGERAIPCERIHKYKGFGKEDRQASSAASGKCGRVGRGRSLHRLGREGLCCCTLGAKKQPFIAEGCLSAAALSRARFHQGSRIY